MPIGSDRSATSSQNALLSVLDREPHLGKAAPHRFVFSSESKPVKRDERVARAVVLTESSSICQYVLRHLLGKSVRNKKRSTDLTDEH